MKKPQFCFWSGEICRLIRHFNIKSKPLVSLRSVNGRNTYSGVDATWPRFYSDAENKQIAAMLGGGK